MVVIIEDSKENTFHTIFVNKNTHRSGSSPDLPKGSLDEIRGTNHPPQSLLSSLKLLNLHP
jgi:hypothetical protein